MHSVDLDSRTACPVLTIQSATFHWRTNFQQLLQHFSTLPKSSILIAITETSHEDFSDFCLNFPVIMKRINQRGIREPVDSKKLWVDCCLEFLKIHCDHHILNQIKVIQQLNGSNSCVLVEDKAIRFVKYNMKENWDDDLNIE